jgi:hypothetical protein
MDTTTMPTTTAMPFQTTSANMFSGDWGVASALLLSYILPGEQNMVRLMLAGTIGNVVQNFIRHIPFPSFPAVFKRVAFAKTHAVILMEGTRMYEQLERYIVETYASKMRCSILYPQHGAGQTTTTFGLQGALFKEPLFDNFEGQSIQLRMLKVDGSWEWSAETFRAFLLSTSSHTMVDQDVSMASASGTSKLTSITRRIKSEEGGNGRGDTTSNCVGTGRIVVSSLKLDIATLQRYVHMIASKRPEAKISILYIVESKPTSIKPTRRRIYDHDSDDDAGHATSSASTSKKSASVDWLRIPVVSNVTLQNIVLSSSINELIIEDVRRFMRSEQWYNTKGIPWKRGYLLSGLPGTGKTSIIKALASEFHLPIFSIDFETVVTDRQFSKLMREISALADNLPYLLAIEDFDRCRLFSTLRLHENQISNRCSSKDVSDEESLTMGCLLNELDGFQQPHGRILMFTANDESKLFENDVDTSALFRPGRLDVRAQVGHCDADQVRRLLFHFFTPSETCRIDDPRFQFPLTSTSMCPAMISSWLQGRVLSLSSTTTVDDLSRVWNECVDHYFRDDALPPATASELDHDGESCVDTARKAMQQKKAIEWPIKRLNRRQRIINSHIKQARRKQRRQKTLIRQADRMRDKWLPGLESKIKSLIECRKKVSSKTREVRLQIRKDQKKKALVANKK